jgi:general stress protein CsbA
MGAFDNLLVALILTCLAIIIYCKITKKTFGELILELKEAFGENTYEQSY